MVEFSEDIKGAIAHSNKMRKSLMASGSYSSSVSELQQQFFTQLFVAIMQGDQMSL
jgi:hypothetical protein